MSDGPPELRLFTVRVSGPGRSAWQVAVRAEDEAAAVAKLTARGHRVVGITVGHPKSRRLEGVRPTRCVNCAYDLRNLPAGSGREVTCPECGVINGPVELPALDHLARKRRAWRLARLFAWGFVGVVLAAVLLRVL